MDGIAIRVMSVRCVAVDSRTSLDDRVSFGRVVGVGELEREERDWRDRSRVLRSLRLGRKRDLVECLGTGQPFASLD